MAPLILGQFDGAGDREIHCRFHPAEVSGETNTHDAARTNTTDDGFVLASPEVVSRPEPCYHPNQKVPRRFTPSSSSTVSVETQTSEETSGDNPDAEVRISTRESPALMEGVDADADEVFNGDRNERVGVDDVDEGLRMSSCHCPACPASTPDGDADLDEYVDEDAVSEDEEAEENTGDDAAQETVGYTTEEAQTDASSGYKTITPPTGNLETEDHIANKGEGSQTETPEEKGAQETSGNPPHENIAVLIRRKRDERLQRLDLARAAESEVKLAEVILEAASKPETSTPEPKPTPPPAPPVDKNREFNSAPPGRTSVHARPKPSSYKRAHILTVHWASSSTREPPPAVQELKQVASRIYGYSVTHCALAPRRHAAGVLAGALAEVVDEYAGTKDPAGNSDTLVILHYVGASRTDAHSFTIYPPTWPCRAPSVEVDLQSLLADTLLSPAFPSDVLVVLDCQYACNIGGTPQAGKEILAACTEPTGFCIRTPTRDMKFTWAIAHTLAQARYALHPFTDQLEKMLVEDGTHRKGRPARLPEVAGLMVGNGPARRHILLSPVVAPWTYWVGPGGESSSGSASSGSGSSRCAGCGTLKEDGVACRCKAGPIMLGDGGEEILADIELGEVVSGGLFVIGEE